MAGILDSKERVMDFIITDEGKRQATSDGLKVRYASFTDYHTYYETSGSLSLPNLASDASSRIFFEAYSRHQDTIVPELIGGVNMTPFRAGQFQVVGGVVADGTFRTGLISSLNVMLATASIDGQAVYDGIDYQAVSGVLNGITQNFNDQRIIGSIDEFSASQNFTLSTDYQEFKIDDLTVYGRTSQKSSNGVVNLEDVPSIFNDKRFSHFPNFEYLPPENVPKPGQEKGDPLGHYPMLNEEPILSLQDVLKDLDGKQKVEIHFDPTSRNNNIVCQVFETGAKEFTKLSVVDFGTFADETPGSPESLESPDRRVFFVGKVKPDASGAETFLCLFTVIID